MSALTSLNATRSSHRWSELPGAFDRLNLRAIYSSGNRYGIPDIYAARFVPILDQTEIQPARFVPDRLVAYNARHQIAAAKSGAAVHFFLDDYRFEVVWAKPERGLSRIAQVGAALTPDFSLWRDMPLVMQQWQVYRSRWCGCWMAEHGIQVIPTISWSTPESYDFCFEGIAAGSVVAVSMVGVRDALAQRLFASGYEEMLARLQPSLVLIYGRLAGEHILGDTPVRCYPTRWES